MSEQNPYYVELHDAFPALDAAQRAWMSQVDSMAAPDRKTHELVRLACTVILRSGDGVARHAQRAAEVGATWEEIAGTVLLTQPGFGLLPAVEAMPHARKGFEQAEPPEADD
jgi:alkylhydroperoxidase/carboxymuconolactone decarboxylase family protein YurZ